MKQRPQLQDAELANYLKEETKHFGSIVFAEHIRCGNQNVGIMPKAARDLLFIEIIDLTNVLGVDFYKFRSHQT